MNEANCTDMLIEDLDVSQQCLDSLPNAGFITVDELVEFLGQIWGGRAGTLPLSGEFIKHFDETMNRLREIGCWPEGLE